MKTPKKSLGQHWLTDEVTLEYICERSNLSQGDTVLEVGPGKGSLTKKLLERGVRVTAVEKDEALVKYLTSQVFPGDLTIINDDILKFDLTKLPPGYKVIANIPYYLTSNLLRYLGESVNPPVATTLLVQKEVARRICAAPGEMSVLAVSVQLYYECRLGLEVPASLFTPPPKVDSQVVLLKRRAKPLFPDLDTSKFFRIVKAGFSEKRKKLRSSLAGGLQLSKEEADNLLARAGLDGSSRAQELSLENWYDLTRVHWREVSGQDRT